MLIKMRHASKVVVKNSRFGDIEQVRKVTLTNLSNFTSLRTTAQISKFQSRKPHSKRLHFLWRTHLKNFSLKGGRNLNF